MTEAGGDANIDSDLDEVRIPGSVRVAGGLHTFSGLIALLTGFQLSSLRFHADLASYVPYILLGTGLFALVLGTMVYRGKGNAAIVATVLAALHLIGGGVWFVMLLSWGVMSLVAMLVPVIALAALGFGGYMLPKILRIDAARQRLAKSGLSFGV
ncbi:MAG: hypothetical protein AAGE52_16555 [Myxococcota bacterium]